MGWYWRSWARRAEAGGSYTFLREIYGRGGVGRWASFLYIWQLGFSAPLSIASGCIGLAQYAAYLWPSLGKPVPSVPHLRYTSLLAAATCLLILALLYRNLSAIRRLAWVLWTGVLLTIGSVIIAGVTHFHASQLTMPAGAFHLTPAFFQGLGAATLIATYDYWGYTNLLLGARYAIGADVRALCAFDCGRRHTISADEHQCAR